MNDHRLLPRYRKTEPVRTATPAPQRSFSSSSDEKHIRLRGVPVLAQGVGGAQLGTRPERAVLRLDR